MPTALHTTHTTEEVHPDVDELKDDMDAAMVEAIHLIEDVVTATRNGPETVNT